MADTRQSDSVVAESSIESQEENPVVAHAQTSIDAERDRKIVTQSDTTDRSETTESNEIFTYRHESGEIITATAQELGRCAFFAGMHEEQRVFMARQFSMGQELQKQIEENEEEEAEETEAQNEQETLDVEDASDKKSRNKVEQEPKKEFHKTEEAKVIKKHAEANQSDESTWQKPEIIQSVSMSTRTQAMKTKEFVRQTALPQPEKLVSQTLEKPNEESGKATAANNQESFEVPKGVVAEAPTWPIPEIKSFPEQSEPSSGGMLESELVREEYRMPVPETMDLHESSLIVDEEYQIPEFESKAEHIAAENDMVVVEDEFQLSGNEQFNDLLEEHWEESEKNDQLLELELAPPELTMQAEGVEEVIIQAAERIHELEIEQADVAEKASEILDEILIVIGEAEGAKEAMQETENQEEDRLVDEAEEKLKELFTELFETVGIEYSPELIEECARLALTGSIKEATLNLKQDEEDILIPHDVGTHEVLKQLLTAASGLRQSILRAYEIGRAVLMLASSGKKIYATSISIN